MYLNAHCHLELSHLKGKVRPGLPFTDWLREIYRMKQGTTAEDSRRAAAEGLRRARETGTSALFDILSLGHSEEPLRRELGADSGFEATLFWEMIRFPEEEGPRAVEDALGRQDGNGALPPGGRHGLSPHAPYTTSGPLLRAAAREAANRGQWLCIHAAETPEETEMMERGTGALREFLEIVLPADWKPPGMRPIPWLDECGCLGPRTLLVHCNDIDEADIRLMRERKVSAVVCPGTHVYFDRGPFPLARLLEAGIPTFLGTDSLSSNEDLDMAREITLAAELSPGVPRDIIEQLASSARAGLFLRTE